jgi:lysophospholipase L1-like esterase
MSIPQSNSRLFRATAKALLLTTSVLLALGLMELALRLIELNPSKNERKVQAPDPELDGLPLIEPIAGLMRSNTRGIFNGVLHRTNSDGFRGREYAKEKPAGTFRTVLIGDSFTMGSGVAEHETYASTLEQRLGREDRERDYEVLNLGVGGFDLRASVMRLKQIGLKYDPDLVVYGWTLNDIEGPSYRRAPKRKPSTFWLKRLQIRWRNLRDRFFPEPGSYVAELDENYFENPQAWSFFLDNLDELTQITKTRDVCGVVFLHTFLRALRWQHPFERHYDAVAEAARERGLFVVPSLSYHRSHSPSSLWVNPGDSHPNAEGHTILAEALFDGLQSLPAQCRFALTR